MTTHDTPRGSFEHQLLGELKEYVATRPASPTPPRRPAHRRRVAGAVALTAGVGAALGIGIPTLTGAGSTPAYAVTRNADGTIKVLIREYSDPQGLQNKLRSFGVDADVTYVPNGKTCQEPRAKYLPYDKTPNVFSDLPATTYDQVGWELHADLIKPGQTFVYTVWYTKDASESAYRIATGPVGPCHLVSGGPDLESGSASAPTSPASGPGSASAPTSPASGPGSASAPTSPASGPGTASAPTSPAS